MSTRSSTRAMLSALRSPSARRARIYTVKTQPRQTSFTRTKTCWYSISLRASPCTRRRTMPPRRVSLQCSPATSARAACRISSAASTRAPPAFSSRQRAAMSTTGCAAHCTQASCGVSIAPSPSGWLRRRAVSSTRPSAARMAPSSAAAFARTAL